LGEKGKRVWENCPAGTEERLRSLPRRGGGGMGEGGKGKRHGEFRRSQGPPPAKYLLPYARLRRGRKFGVAGKGRVCKIKRGTHGQMFRLRCRTPWLRAG